REECIEPRLGAHNLSDGVRPSCPSPQDANAASPVTERPKRQRNDQGAELSGARTQLSVGGVTHIVQDHAEAWDVFTHPRNGQQAFVE
ncbi:MAG: hypothetical protein AB7K71_36730, partial [Polyangiaceae bacterium]